MLIITYLVIAVLHFTPVTTVIIFHGTTNLQASNIQVQPALTVSTYQSTYNVQIVSDPLQITINANQLQ